MGRKLIIPIFYRCENHYGTSEDKPEFCDQKDKEEKGYKLAVKRWGGRYSPDKVSPTCTWAEEAKYQRTQRIRDFKRAKRIWAPLFDNIWFHGTGKRIMLRHYCEPKDGWSGKDISEWLKEKKESGNEPGGLIAKKRCTGWVGHREDKYYLLERSPHLRDFHMADYGIIHCGSCNKVFGTREEVEEKVRKFASKIDKKSLAGLALFLRV